MVQGPQDNGVSAISAILVHLSQGEPSAAICLLLKTVTTRPLILLACNPLSQSNKMQLPRGQSNLAYPV